MELLCLGVVGVQNESLVTRIDAFFEVPLLQGASSDVEEQAQKQHFEFIPQNLEQSSDVIFIAEFVIPNPFRVNSRFLPFLSQSQLMHSIKRKMARAL